MHPCTCEQKAKSIRSSRSGASKSVRARDAETRKAEALLAEMMREPDPSVPLLSDDLLLDSLESSGDSLSARVTKSSSRKQKGGSVRSGRSGKSRTSGSSKLGAVVEGEDSEFVPLPSSGQYSLAQSLQSTVAGSGQTTLAASGQYSVQ